MTDVASEFGALLRGARERAGSSRAELGKVVGLDASHLFRLETGGRRPSAAAVVSLADALDVSGEDRDRWLVAAGFAPMGLLSLVRGGVRTRGSLRVRQGVGARGGAAGSEAENAPPPGTEAARWAEWLDALGLGEEMIRRLLEAMERSRPPERDEAAKAVRTTLTRVADMLDAPVRTAVVPIAGRHHRVLAVDANQLLLLRVIREAVEAGARRVVLVLAPGGVDTLYEPLRSALDLSLVPRIDLRAVQQAEPLGLGDAVLQAEELVGKEPFIVLLPDDVARLRPSRAPYSRDLRRMLQRSRYLVGAPMIAVSRVPRSKLGLGGVARLGRASAEQAAKGIRPVSGMVEKPDAQHPIARSKQPYHIVGRYVLGPEIFPALHALRAEDRRPLHLTDAIERLRLQGSPVYAFELEAPRGDMGAVLGRARELIEGKSAGTHGPE